MKYAFLAIGLVIVALLASILIMMQPKKDKWDPESDQFLQSLQEYGNR